jgi:putative heme-binding domain-containing protein
MKFATHLFCAVAALNLFAATDPFAEGVRTTEPLTAEEQQKTFKLPPGFTVQLVAAEPQLRKPMNMQFDGAGRLWFTESREYPWATNTAPRDTIRILSDFDANGRAQIVTTFATNLNIPIGLYPFQSPSSDGSGKLTWKCIGWSIPNIWLFEDLDGDLVADKKEKLLGPFDHTRDTHGNQASFRRGNDGWIYATHGFNNRSKVAGKDGHEVTFNSGNTYRFRMDGSRIEHWTHGQVNPFGLTFDALGNLYSADCHSSPIYQLLRGGFYPSFGAPDDGLGFAPTTIQHSHGSTAICGITVLDDPSWPEEFRDNLIIGNVMPSRINRDRVEWRGSTSVGHEMPDLVSVTDPWFRPVDLQLGPDGALWVADFYNRIIGHYEVPLVHPGRDRERGRIWRILPPKQSAANVPLATSLTIPNTLAGLVTELGSSNRTRRVLAQHRLNDVFGTNAVPMLRDTARGVYQFPDERGKIHAQVHAAWALMNFNQLDDESLMTLVNPRTPETRVHAARLIAEAGHRLRGKIAGAITPPSLDNLRAALFMLLEDSDAQVQRAAADALGVFPASGNVPVLLAALNKTPAADTHLVHVLRMSLRDSLAASKDFSELAVDEKSSRALAGIAPAVTNAAAASFLVAHLQKYSESRSTAARQLRHAARFLPENRIDDLATLARDKFRDDVDLQSALFKSVQDGLSQRGVALSPQMKQWGTMLAGDLLKSVERNETGWTSLPVESNPWAVQNRKSSDGRDADFLCTLPAGETLTGILRSKNFAAPAKLTFWMAGHDGYPDKPLQKKNFVVLRDAKTSAVLLTAPAPRNDVAKSMTWDLGAHAGQQVFLELVDGDTAGAYAWLAVGRFEPAVVALPKTTPKVIDERLTGAAQIALATRDASLETPLTAALKIPAGVEARGSVAATLLAMNTKQHLPAVGKIMNDTSAPDALRQRIAQTIAESNTDDGRALVVGALQRTPEKAQPKFALALSGTKPGAEALLKEVEAGRVSARLLQNQALKEKLTASKADNVKARLTKLTANLTPLNEQLQKLIDQRAKTFGNSKASAANGVAVFEKNCAACHQLDGKGALVGPQLDGVGARGVERIMEDIIDPNRNVDGAFRSTLFELKDGETASGLFRREEGELLIYADTAGKEHSLARKDIKERRQSELSLMPEGLAEAMTPAEFNDLIAFLLTKTAAKH